MDWLKATTGERKALHRVTSAILKTEGLGWQQFFLDELKPPLHVADTYHQSNFAKGTIARGRALRIYNWIVANHLDLAVRLDPRLFDPSLKSDWQHFLGSQGRYGDAQLVRPQHGRNLVERADKNPVADNPVPLGQSFWFLIRNAIDGFVLGLEEYEGDWFPMALAHDDVTMAVPCPAGKQPLPYNIDTGQPVMLSERADAGLHGFAFLVGPESLVRPFERQLTLGHAILPETLDAIAHDFIESDAGTMAVHRLNIIFVNG
ncbi:hypothetical protein [Afifella marina]|uniref:Uncharacterized protein n=1 Tax=Afifella marina DSM 2698 TaxID=1120955 RepID=A0A1G5NAI4_AFIMA|nr:hypothetical protein [Afifella marina]SCZ34164.1 hypothetical protein SAMN03080610_01647 [Afifella marina DSM 2698]